MTRSALVGLIHGHTMKMAGVSYDNRVGTTLMSTDADSLDGIAEMIHEIWAQIAEVLLGIWLLAVQEGWIWLLPLSLIHCKYLNQRLPVLAVANICIPTKCALTCVDLLQNTCSLDRRLGVTQRKIA